jgi:hypothetical protein
VVASCGLNFAMASMSPVSATTVVYFFSDSRSVMSDSSRVGSRGGVCNTPLMVPTSTKVCCTHPTRSSSHRARRTPSPSSIAKTMPGGESLPIWVREEGDRPEASHYTFEEVDTSEGELIEPLRAPFWAGQECKEAGRGGRRRHIAQNDGAHVAVGAMFAGQHLRNQTSERPTAAQMGEKRHRPPGDGVIRCGSASNDALSVRS